MYLDPLLVIKMTYLWFIKTASETTLDTIITMDVVDSMVDSLASNNVHVFETCAQAINNAVEYGK